MKKCVFVIDHEELRSGSFFEGFLQEKYSEQDIEEYINDYSPEKGKKITVYELVPVAVYEVTSGFKKL